MCLHGTLDNILSLEIKVKQSLVPFKVPFEFLILRLSWFKFLARTTPANSSDYISPLLIIGHSHNEALFFFFLRPVVLSQLGTFRTHFLTVRMAGMDIISD